MVWRGNDETAPKGEDSGNTPYIPYNIESRSMRHRFTLLRSTLLGLLLISASLSQAADNKPVAIHSLRAYRAPDNTRLVLDLSAPASYRAFTLARPDRLVIDLDNSRLLYDLKQFTVPRGPVTTVRSAINGQTLRLVLELSAPIELRHFMLAPNEKYGQRLVLDLLDMKAADLPSDIAAAIDAKEAQLQGGPQKAAQAVASLPALALPPLTPPMPTISPPQTHSAAAESGTTNKTASSSLDKVSTLAKPVIAAAQHNADPLRDKADPLRDKIAELRVNDSSNGSKPAATEAPSPVTANSHNGTAGANGRPIIIAIDAGHGGEDSGAVGPDGHYEKNVVLAIARKIEAAFRREKGVMPVLTRTDDYFIPLKERRQIARDKYNADIFISVHADAASSAKAKGSSVFALTTKKASSVMAAMLAKRENESDRIGGVMVDDKDDDLRLVIASMILEGSMQHGRIIGRNVLAELDTLGPLHAEQVEQAGFAVLKEPAMVSILVETGFITNPQEEAKLSDNKYQEKIATAIVRGALRYCRDNAAPGTWFAYQREIQENRGKHSESDDQRGMDKRIAVNDRKAPASADLSAVAHVASTVSEISVSAPVPETTPEAMAVHKSTVAFVRVQENEHRVMPGDTLEKISRRYKVPAQTLMEYNAMASNAEVEPGQILRIPKAK